MNDLMQTLKRPATVASSVDGKRSRYGYYAAPLVQRGVSSECETGGLSSHNAAKTIPHPLRGSPLYTKGPLAIANIVCSRIRVLASLGDGSRGRLRPHAPKGDGRSFCLHKNSSTATRSPLGEGASRAPRSWRVAGMQSRPMPPSGREVSCVSMTEGARATLKSSHFIVHALSPTRCAGAPSRREPLMRPAMEAFPLTGEGVAGQATDEGVPVVLAYRGERSFCRYEKTHVAV